MTINGLYKSSYFIFEWLQVLCFKLWEISDFCARLPSVLSHLLSIVLMYFITAKFSKNKYVWLFSSVIFWMLYRELWRWRNARFYSLLQCMFLLGMLLIHKWIEKGDVKFLNFSILFVWLGMVFHPFLYSVWVIFILAFLSQYKKKWNVKSLFSKKYLITRILVVTWLVMVMFYWTLWAVLKWTLTSGLPWDMKKFYLIFYNKHLRSELWIIYIFWIFWMIRFLLKRKTQEIIFLFVPFLLFVYALIIKWYLMHSRYALLMFPLIIVSACIFVCDLIRLLKYNYEKIIFSLLIIWFVWLTSHFQFIPVKVYYFDYTSPQPDFKSAYAVIPDDANVISWFPTLCDWYYADRGTCLYAIRVDLIHDWKIKIITKKSEKYTKIEYIDNIDDLKSWVYYFVVDNLTYKSENINTDLYNQIFSRWREIFSSWESYNNIVVMEIQVV